MTGLRALRESGSQPTPEHTARQPEEGTDSGEPWLLPHRSPVSHQRKAFSRGFLLAITKSASLAGWRTLRQVVNHLLSKASAQMLAVVTS